VGGGQAARTIGSALCLGDLRSRRVDPRAHARTVADPPRPCSNRRLTYLRRRATRANRCGSAEYWEAGIRQLSLARDAPGGARI
jgi:hypothetical protein